MAKEYFLALDERGLRLFDSKPHLECEESRPIHWQWIDNLWRKKNRIIKK
jgi:hypothetical protein